MVRILLLLLIPMLLKAATLGRTNAYSFPVQIEIGPSTGSGFLLAASNKLFLVTAKHVLLEINSTNRPLPLLGTNLAFSSWSDKGRGIVNYNIGYYYTNNEVRYSNDRDVVVVHICNLNDAGLPSYATSFMGPSQNWKPAIFPTGFARKMVEVNMGDNVYTFGYPASIGSIINVQLDKTRALARKGIVADVDPARKIIVVDMPVYFGNSGGPLMAVDDEGFGNLHTTIVGVVSAFVPFEDVWISQRYKLPNLQWSNSGYGIVEPIDFVLDLLW